MTRTLEQKRAVFAMSRIMEWTAWETGQDKILTLVQKAPVQILQNGLGQALAFLLADNEGQTGTELKPSGYLYQVLQTWLCSDDKENHPCRVYRSGRLVDCLMEGNRDQYLRAQQEALSLLFWLKQFAVANLR